MLTQASGEKDDIVCVDLRPDRSLSPRGLVAVFCSLALVVMVVAAVSAGHGNVYAPLFGLAELPFVGWALWWAARRLDHGEQLELSPAALVVRRSEDRREWRFNPYWVRVERGTEDRRGVLLASHGRAVRVGAFLSDGERDRLETLLRGGLTKIRSTREPITSEQEQS